MKVTERQTAEYIRDFAEELAMMADGIKLEDVGRALQTAALKAEEAIGRTRNGTRPDRFRRPHRMSPPLDQDAPELK